ncbi:MULTISPECIES: hypothetical protein [Methylobacterium]|uniref:hypothetical protein n=1 Tax=Methylobacterium TaxID=407 RepID=UPI0013ED6E19|nr:hypothetical protein [Methylobacterium sp. DB0501]NGM33348.1 hypothetical protein [Methylobacterium sp. DB0501]
MAERSTSRRAILTGLAAASTVPAGIGLAHSGAGEASDPLHAEAYRRLLIGYRWHQQARVVSNEARFNSLEEAAATKVSHWLWDQADKAFDLPAPRTATGMRTLVFAMAIMLEGEAANEHFDTEAKRAIRFVRAVMSSMGLTLPEEYPGFGDEPDHNERDAAIMTRPGWLPAWALDGRSEPYPSDLMGGMS